MTRNDIDYLFYANTEGCIILKDDFNSIAVAYRWSRDPDEIDPNGMNIHIVFMEGDMKNLLCLVSDDIGFISFERREETRIRTYDFKKFRKKLFG